MKNILNKKQDKKITEITLRTKTNIQEIEKNDITPVFIKKCSCDCK